MFVMQHMLDAQLQNSEAICSKNLAPPNKNGMIDVFGMKKRLRPKLMDTVLADMDLSSDENEKIRATFQGVSHFRQAVGYRKGTVPPGDKPYDGSHWMGLSKLGKRLSQEQKRFYIKTVATTQS